MKLTNRNAGIVGMTAAGLWLAMVFIEYFFKIPSPGNSRWLANQFIMFVALTGYLFMLLGLWQSKAAGNGVFSKISLGIFIIGMAAWWVAHIIHWETKGYNSFLYPVGDTFQLLGSLLTGIAVVITKRWTGWQRFAPLLQGIYTMTLFVIYIRVLNQPPTQLTDGLWQATWFLTSLALFTNSDPS